MEVRVAEVTVTFVEPDIDPEVAVIVAGPGATPVTAPEVSTVAMVGADDVHWTDDEMLRVLPSS
jgi:hypothetical protein